jgi:hypothetical protein
MVHLQIISRNAADVQAALRSAIEEQRMTTFEIERIRGGLRLRHKRFRGEVRFHPTDGPLLVTVRSPKSNNEWQLLSAFIGRLADRFRDQVSSVSIQFQSTSGVARRPGPRRRPVARRRPKKARPRRPAARGRARRVRR